MKWLPITLAVLICLGLAGPAHGDTVVVDDRPTTASAGPLPTVQINGVVWSQTVVAGTVFAGGNFTAARPAGAAAGSSEVGRTHLLAYDIQTGNLLPSFAPSINGQVLAVASSPDGRRVYIGGQFTSVNGKTRQRIAAFDTATGTLVESFAPSAGSTVRAIAATDSTVYFGGDFQTVSGQSRRFVAAASSGNGTVQSWNPGADASVTALTMNPTRSTVVVGGRFTTLAGAARYGMGAVDALTGASQPWAIESVVRTAGVNASITSLVADDASVYGTAYTYGSGGNFEGTFRAQGQTGALEWLADCHGDHYSAWPTADAVYTTSHAHYCGNIEDGFQDSNPRSYSHSTALTNFPAQPNRYNPRYGLANFDGRPSPALLHWYPVWSVGSFTGQTQAGWHVTGDERFVVVGGEFPAVNGRAQQGLVRFSRTDPAASTTAPQRLASLTPKAVSVRSGQVDVGWQATFDRDNRELTYELLRGQSVVLARQVASTPWTRPTISYADNVPAGSVQTYRVRVTDPHGRSVTSEPASVSVAGDANPYGAAVIASNPEHWFRLNEPTGASVIDSRGAADATGPATLTRGVSGPLADGDRATVFPGNSNGFVATDVSQHSPQVFSIEAWFKTTTKVGGRIVGHGDKRTGTSKTGFTDRHLYMDNQGRVHFGVDNGSKRTIRSTTSLNDNLWHHVVGTLGPDGQRLYIDGKQAAVNTSVTAALNVRGHWRIGGDTLSGWGSRPSSDSFAGAIDEVAVYHRVLSAAEVSAHRAAADGTPPPPAGNLPPTAAFTATADGLTVSLDAAASTDNDGSITAYNWDLGDGSTASGANPRHTYDAPGTYQVRLTVTDDDAATGTTTKPVTVTAPPPPPAGNLPPTAAFTATADGLTVSLDAAASTDTDGSITAYNWDLGDGSTASGANPRHTYDAPGTYQVRLTVTDDDAATGTTTKPVTVTAPPPPQGTFAEDAFTRSLAAGWGDAQVGGPWTTAGGSFSVDGAAGLLSARAGQSASAYLGGAQRLDQDVTLSIAPQALANGGGSYVNVAVRGDSSNAYRTKLWFSASGAVTAQLIRVAGGAQAGLTAATATGITAAPGTKLQVRVQAIGNGTTQLRAKVWRDGQSEPASWLVSATDSTATLQKAAGVGLFLYVSGSATNAPVAFAVDDLKAV